MAWTAAKRKAHGAKMKAMWAKKREAGKWGKSVIDRPEVQEAQEKRNDILWRQLNFIEPAPHLKIMDMKYNPHFEKDDMVNHPAHYTFGKFEVADVADDWYATEPLLWNANKYMARWDKKGDPIENLEKAIWYIQRKINKLKEQQNA